MYIGYPALVPKTPSEDNGAGTRDRVILPYRNLRVPDERKYFIFILFLSDWAQTMVGSGWALTKVDPTACLLVGELLALGPAYCQPQSWQVSGWSVHGFDLWHEYVVLRVQSLGTGPQVVA